MVELYSHRAALIIDIDRLIKAAMFNPNIVEHPKRRPGKVAELWVVSFSLKFTDNDDRDDHLMFGESANRRGICQQNAGI